MAAFPAPPPTFAVSNPTANPGADSDSDVDVDGEAGSEFFGVANEILLLIFGFLDPLSLNRVAAVCRRWRVWARDPLLWRTLCASLLPQMFGTVAALPDTAGRSKTTTPWYKYFRGFFLAQTPSRRAAIADSSAVFVAAPALYRQLGAHAHSPPDTVHRVPRSTTVVLAKLPYDIDASTVARLASAQGYVLNVIVRRRRFRRARDDVWAHPRRRLAPEPEPEPPHAVAYVKYMNHADAMAAFAFLADLEFDGVPADVQLPGIGTFNPIDGYV